jgi:calcium/calmodulin-dependent protein kinase I
VIDKSQVGKEVSPKSLQTEVEVLKSITHPYIIQLKGVFEDEDNLYIVTEIAVGGELFDRILNKGAYSERFAAELVRRILSGIDYLHDRKIVHRDLKPENLLLFSDDDLDIRICDFGLAKVVGSNTLIQTVVGSPNYVAPEVLQGMGYWKQADLWSIGVITYILLCGYPPFASPDIRDLLDLIQSGVYEYEEEYWDGISDMAKNFIDHLLVTNPESRYTAKQALDHPWIKMCEQTNENPGKILEVGTQMKETLEDWRGKAAAAANEDVRSQFDDEDVSDSEGGLYEMRAAPFNCSIPTSSSSSVGISVTSATPTASFFLFLYETIGGPKKWPARTSEAIQMLLSEPGINIGLLTVNGAPAGFIELDSRTSGETEITCIGVLPEHQRRESAYLKLLVDFAIAHSFSNPTCGRLFSKSETGVD